MLAELVDAAASAAGDLPGAARSLAPAIAKIVSIAAVLAQIALIPAVLVRRKESASTIAWILTLLFLPVIGGVLFVLFGRERLRLSATRKLAAQAGTRARLPANATPRGLALERLSAEDRPLFRVGSLLGNTQATEGNRVRLFSRGAEAIDAKLAAIARAERSVHAEYYLVRDDVTGHQFRRALIDAAARGARVRLLVDGFGSLAVGPAWERALAGGGVQLARFLPIAALGAGLSSRWFGAFQWNLRNHRKILVIDGQVAFTGGVNVGDDVREWRDTHLRIEGPAVAALQSMFIEDWEFATGRAVDDGLDFPTSEADHEAEAIVEVVGSGPDRHTEAIHRVFFSAIANARTRVALTTPYFVPDRALMVALATAALSGVEVQLLVPAHSNHRVTWAAGRAYYDELLEAGVQIWEYQPGLVHAKTILVDRRVALIGSANLDNRSFRLNFEVHTIIRSAAVAASLEAIFEADLARSVRLDRAAFAQRGLRARVAEGFGRLMAPML